MGHANLTNISVFFIDQLVEKRTVTIREVVSGLRKAKEAVHASEGLLTDRSMLGYSVENVVGFLLERHGTTARTPERKKKPVIEPVEPLTKRQEKLLQEFCEGDIGNWDCGKNGEGGEYGAFDRIKWKLTKTWESIPKDQIPVLGRFEN
jgi:hypothetical protein